MKIGELAQRASCQVETIRYYEREGLLPEPARSAGNYRLYGMMHVERLMFIRHCRALDMTLGEIRRLLLHRDHPERDCAEVNDLVDEHIGHVETRLAQLDSLRTALIELRARCRGDADIGACGILRELAQPADEDEESGESPAVRHIGGAH
ncbi:MULTISPECIES: Cd(II)/Pb(II)-responsive transcriptional regulator [Halomonadaceae]|uniref:Cd(II)/Pb(II)-responsive transcriptional regulator n=1 Tax=Modicisalibacter zincidurans TaxID=1178777 RepID=A0ABP9REC8_9GAMM|nr:MULTISPECIES: Cd(II)/Pb(II)-responsive transcriptional regulator [Halomonas]MCD6007592.1 Cd(II)/Pb(II)-responsive transcriptional regulator [Halomonas sp. IOP_31]MEA3250658.1 Cd(II)/Pb(II)-responsive transcriptional regulator [Pseudomonadota bacterium]